VTGYQLNYNIYSLSEYYRLEYYRVAEKLVLGAGKTSFSSVLLLLAETLLWGGTVRKNPRMLPVLESL
jgi:hypothetical protein